MKWIKENFIKKALTKVRPEEKVKPTVESIQSVGIIASSLVELNETKDSIEALFGKNIRIAALFYGEGSEAKEAFSYKDFSLSGKPKSKISRFIDGENDLLVVSAGRLNIFSLYLLYLNPQSYSVGFYHESHTPYLDMMLAKEDLNQKQNVDNLIKYLKQVI